MFQLHVKNWFVSFLFTDTEAADDDVAETDTLESTLQQTMKALHAKQQQLEDEQKQVNTSLLNKR